MFLSILLVFILVGCEDSKADLTKSSRVNNLNKLQVVKSSCQIEPPFNCVDSSSVGRGVQLKIITLNSINDVPKDKISVNINGVPCRSLLLDPLTSSSFTLDTNNLLSGQTTVITCIHSLRTGSRFQGDISIAYDYREGLKNKVARGSFSGMVTEDKNAQTIDQCANKVDYFGSVPTERKSECYFERAQIERNVELCEKALLRKVQCISTLASILNQKALCSRLESKEQDTCKRYYDGSKKSEV